MKRKNKKDLLDELGLADVSEEKKQELLTKITEALLKRMYVETVERLKEKDQREFAELLKRKADLEEVDDFLGKKIPNYDQVLEKIAVDFKAEISQGLV